jgi:UDP-N-acetylmuramoyl-L-alanyl-D-glutamate--2,6-diaminopimelate ligase
MFALMPSEPCPSRRQPYQQQAQQAFEQYPQQPSHQVCVTGTNGKTSVVDFVRQFWSFQDLACASIGTLGIQCSLSAIQSQLAQEPWMRGPSLTTYDALRFHQLLQFFARNHVEYVAFEASSHGLDQCRCRYARIHGAAFTNLTRDHLDYHQTEQDYFLAKTHLFTEMLPAHGLAVLNRDTPYFASMRSLCQQHGHSIFEVSAHESAAHTNLRAQDITPSLEGISFRIMLGERAVWNGVIPIFGSFQVSNILLAMGLVHSTGIAIETMLPHLSGLHAAPGRMEPIRGKSGALMAWVDYAHTPDALRVALQAARWHTPGDLWVVFGCGGNRDTGKRALMGQVAQRWADHILVTDDNPRTEDPAAIRAAILSECPRAIEMGSRDDAIDMAIKNLKHGDRVLIAGKGHESTQTIGTQCIPMDDREIVRAILA